MLSRHLLFPSVGASWRVRTEFLCLKIDGIIRKNPFWMVYPFFPQQNCHFERYIIPVSHSHGERQPFCSQPCHQNPPSWPWLLAVMGLTCLRLLGAVYGPVPGCLWCRQDMSWICLGVRSWQVRFCGCFDDVHGQNMSKIGGIVAHQNCQSLIAKPKCPHPISLVTPELAKSLQQRSPVAAGASLFFHIGYGTATKGLRGHWADPDICWLQTARIFNDP